MALTKMFRLRWSNEVHNEWTRNVSEKQGVPLERLQSQVQKLNDAIPGATVTGYEHLINGLDLPDPNDRHILAAAIRTNADSILTFNAKDFPQETISKYGIETQHPDVFFLDQIGISSNLFLDAVIEDFLHYKPRMPYETYVEKLRKTGLSETATFLAKLQIIASDSPNQ